MIKSEEDSLIKAEKLLDKGLGFYQNKRLKKALKLYTKVYKRTLSHINKSRSALGISWCHARSIRLKRSKLESNEKAWVKLNRKFVDSFVIALRLYQFSKVYEPDLKKDLLKIVTEVYEDG